MGNIQDTNIEPKKKWKDFNKWLEDSEYIQGLNFEDKYYLESLCHHLLNFIKNVPIPVLATYDEKHKSIYFSVGGQKNYFPLTIDISYYDYITVVKRWLTNFFPKYEIHYTIEIELPGEKILELVNNKKYSLNDALLLREEKVVTETGIIEKEIRREDQFILNINGVKSMRITGNKKPLLLKDFMRELRNISDQQERRDYIMNNSKEFSILPDYKKTRIISYQGEQMKNFFIINLPDMGDYDLKEVELFIYFWGYYTIRFSSITLKKECLQYYIDTTNKKIITLEMQEKEKLKKQENKGNLIED